MGRRVEAERGDGARIVRRGTTFLICFVAAVVIGGLTDLGHWGYDTLATKFHWHGAGTDVAPTRLEVGDTAPNVEVLRTNGGPTDTGFYYNQPAVFVFFMNHACTGCMDELVDLGKHADEFKQAGASIYAISSDKPADSRLTEETLRKRGVTGITVLCDPKLEAIEAFGTQIHDQPISYHSIFIVDKTGTIQFVARGDAAPANLPSPEILLAKVKEMSALTEGQSERGS